MMVSLFQNQWKFDNMDVHMKLQFQYWVIGLHVVKLYVNLLTDLFHIGRQKGKSCINMAL